MKIGIDASRAVKEIKRGPGWYSFYLIRALSEIDFKNQYILYSPCCPPKELTDLPNNFQWQIMPFFRLWTQIRLSWQMLKNPPDLLFVPSHVLPLIRPKKTVLTIHDLGYKYFPGAYSVFERFYENFSLKLAKSASRVIVPSKATKKDLIKYTDIDPQKIVVIYHGFASNFVKTNARPKLDARYILFLGKLEAKKNIVGLVKAFELLKKEQKDLKLVLIGQPGYQYKKIQQAILNLPPRIRKDILELGYLKDPKVSLWLRRACVFVLPSFYEGFGLSVLEALSLGVPTVVSNIPALSEMTDGSALLVDPEDPKGIAGAIKKMLSNKNLREELIKKGLKRTSEFSWQKCAKETLALLEEVGREKCEF